MARTPLPENEKRVIAASFVLPRVKQIILKKAAEEQRSPSFIIAKLLESHPEVKKLLRAA